MAMTDVQLAAFAADIEANSDPIIVTALANNDNNSIQNWYNGQAFPDFWTLRESLELNLVVAAMDWANEYLAFQDDIPAIQLLFAAGYDPRLPNSREALNTLFTGASNSKAAILDISVFEASYVEKLFAVTTTGPGGGDGSAKGQAAIREFNGPVGLDDVRAAVDLIA